MSGVILTASGALKDTPLCELLVYFFERALTGTLVLETPAGVKHALLFESGALCRVKVDSLETRLGHVLTGLGSLTEAACLSASSEDKSGLFGQRLVTAGLDPRQLQWGLHKQFVLQLELLSRLPEETVFGYYEGANFLEGWGDEPLAVDVLATVWAAVRTAPASTRLLKAYASVSALTLRLHRSSRISKFGFEAKERAVLDVLRVMPQSLQQLRATRLADDALLQRLVYALVITAHLDVGKPPIGVKNALPCYLPPPKGAKASRAPRVSRSPKVSVAPKVSSVSRAPSMTAVAVSPGVPVAKSSSVLVTSPPRARDTTSTAQFLTRQEIEKRVSALDGLTAYELLEVAEDCSPDELASTFSRLAKRWHPDRLSPPCADLKESVTRVFAKITEAQRMLSNRELRAEYDESLHGAPLDEEQAQVERILKAAAVFQKAEILVKKRKMERAEELACQAEELDGDQPEYAALHAWIKSCRVDCDEAHLRKMVRRLQETALRQKENVRIHYYLATALKRAGDSKGAMREFKFVAARDPSNLDAVRELRLFSMRSPEVSSTGLFGRLFKR